jgi:membrane-bound serine protease (ClpP class)
MKRKGLTIYALVTTLLEEVALVAVVLWLLPRFGINIPLWGLILLMVALGAYAYITYRLSQKALDKKPMISPEAIVGSKCKATTPLAPEGYIRVSGELWRASSSSNVNAGEEVIVVGIEGMTLLVSPISKDNHESKTEVHSN